MLSPALAVVLAVMQQPPTGAAPSQPPPTPPPAVKVGEPAPDFTLAYLAPPAAEGGRPERKEITLSSFKGKQNVVLAWFPAAFSPG
jgi:AhpC/TSA family